MFNHKEMFESLQTTYGVKIRYKNESGLMRFLGTLLFYNKSFMTDFTTTLGETVYFPSRQWVETDYYNAWEILSHELVHVSDYRNSKPKFLFGLDYMLPQVLVVFGLLGFVFHSWWFLLCLLFLAPLPAPGRREAEMRGYAMTMAVWYWYRGSGIPQALKSDLAQNFTGPQYYFAWPFKSSVKNEIDSWSKKILTDEILEEAVFQGVHDMIKKRQIKAF